jgi:phosphatidylserine/phosphatidylglycerophosphate/cardiolipin synthase-like enzyme
MSGAGEAESKWLLQFTSSTYQSEYGDGRPWGDGTAMAERAKVPGQNPWDAGCKVTPLLGGDATMIAIRKDLEQAIAIGEAKLKEGATPGTFGHVYFTGLQFNGLRDLSSNNPWGGKPWDPKITVEKDQTALGLVIRLMSAGINVRMLLWMPNELEALTLKGLAFEHRCMAAAVKSHSEVLQGKWNPAGPIGVVALDLRTGKPLVSSLHQKMIAIRVGKGTAKPLNVAYCGGVDLAFTRRDFGLAGTYPVGIGDWQSGTKIPVSTNGWPKQKVPPFGGYPTFPAGPGGGAENIGPELDVTVYGSTSQHWHDHHLRLEGPVVATLEEQFVERWAMEGSLAEFKFATSSWSEGQVVVTSSAYIGSGNKLVPLPEPEPVPALSGNTATVQMWRTIPLRWLTPQKSPFVRGEFTVMAGIAKAVLASTKLITICDQYFWSVPLARLLAVQLKAQKNLKLLIVLPPFGSTSGEAPFELGLRQAALKTLYDELENAANRKRVMVRDVWSYAKKRGVYVHAKSQTYDDQLFVCGSANMNRRSLQCDAELDCAVLGKETVQQHLCQLYACFTGSELKVSEPDFFGRFWTEIETKTLGKTLTTDPFFAESVGEPETPNGVKMTPEYPAVYGLFEPTSVKDKVDDGQRNLAEITLLLEQYGDNGTWPYRQANESLEAEDNEEEPEGEKPRMPHLIL